MLSFAFLILSSLCFATDIVLAPGQSQLLPIGGAKPIVVLNKNKFSATEIGGQLRVLVKKPGYGYVVTGSSTIRIHGLSQSQFLFYQRLKATVQNMQGVNLSVKDGEIWIEGQILHVDDWRELARLARHYGGKYLFRANFHQQTRENCLKFLKSHLKFQGHPMVQLDFSGAPKAYISSQKVAPALEQTLGYFGVSINRENHGLPLQPLVRLDILIAELDEKMSRQVGLKWGAIKEGQVLPQFENGKELHWILHAAEGRGLTKVLASPTILTRSGESAEFHSGGEFPIRTRGYMSQGVMWKKHGIIMNLKPSADFTGRMVIEVDVEISVVTDESVDELPSLHKNRIHSSFNLEKPRTVALSGLVRRDWAKSYEGLPLLSSLPILGYLFKSQRFRNNKSELIVFVTPSLEPLNNSSDPLELPKNWSKDDP